MVGIYTRHLHAFRACRGIIGRAQSITCCNFPSPKGSRIVVHCLSFSFVGIHALLRSITPSNLLELPDLVITTSLIAEFNRSVTVDTGQGYIQVALWKEDAVIRS